MRPLMCRLATLAILSLSARSLAGFQIGAITGPSCVIVDSAHGGQIPLAPYFTRVNVVVTDGLAQAIVIQSFANPLSKSTEIAYVFPLPERGAVHAMAFELHDSLYRATIQEKVRAQAIYDSILDAGGQAAILLQERPNLFQQKMANVGPHDTIHVEIELSIPLKYADGSWELAFPTMVGERYPSDGASEPAGTITGWNPPADREGPGFLFNVLVKDAAFDSISSPTHPIRLETSSTIRRKLSLLGLVDSAADLDPLYGRTATLAPQATYPNTDFVLRLHRSDAALDAIVSSWRPANRDTGYFHVAILPELTADNTIERPALDLVLLVDRSGSQSGWPMQREKEIAAEFLRHLEPRDRLTLLAFDDVNEYAFGSSPVPATAANIDSAQRFVSKIEARGSTYLLDAVNAALATPLTGDMKRVFVFLTDGFITNEAAILDAIQASTPQPRILAFGCGGSLNRYFLEEAAAVGNGFATLLTEAEPAIPAVSTAWSRIETAQVEGLRIDFGSMGAHDVILPTSDRLYRGLPLVVDGKYLRGGSQTITLRGQRAGEAWTLTRNVDLATGSSLAWAIPKTWARAAIGQLELAEGTSTRNKDSIIGISLAHQVLSQYTAFLATVGMPQEPDASLANAYNNSITIEVSRPAALLAGRTGFWTRLRAGRLVMSWNASQRPQTIRILDLTGAVVRTLHPGSNDLEATWDGLTESGTHAHAGTYIVELRTPTATLRSRITWTP